MNVTVPDLISSDAKLTYWHKNAGETVEMDELLCEIEVDKVNIEVSACCNGVVHDICKHPGDSVQAGDILCSIR